MLWQENHENILKKSSGTSLPKSLLPSAVAFFCCWSLLIMIVIMSFICVLMDFVCVCVELKWVDNIQKIYFTFRIFKWCAFDESGGDIIGLASVITQIGLSSTTTYFLSSIQMRCVVYTFILFLRGAVYMKTTIEEEEEADC